MSEGMTILFIIGVSFLIGAFSGSIDTISKHKVREEKPFWMEGKKYQCKWTATKETVEKMRDK